MKDYEKIIAFASGFRMIFGIAIVLVTLLILASLTLRTIMRLPIDFEMWLVAGAAVALSLDFLFKGR